MKHEHANDYHAVLSHTRRAALLAACLWVAFSLGLTGQAQIPVATPTPTPTATPEPSATPAPSATPPAATEQEGLAEVRDAIFLTRDELITFRRLVIIMAGIGLGWQTCLLLFKYH